MKKQRFAKSLLAASIAVSGVGLTGQALGAIGLEEIVVTARKREEAIQDIPVAVTAVTGEMFERSAISNFSEATALTPGFAVAPGTTSPQALTLSMRGSVQNSDLITDDHSVGVYVDGVYIARTYGIGMDLLDLDSLQVLKGPQGTLFGRNSTAGALLLKTKDPLLGEFEGSASLTGGTDHTRGELIVNLPLGDMLAFRVAHQENERDDYVKNVANDPNDPLYTQYNNLRPYTASKNFDTEIGGYENSTTRAKLRFAPTDTLDMVLSWEQFESDLKGPIREQVWMAGDIIPRDKGDDTLSLDFDPRAYAETETLNFTATYEADFGELTFIAGNREYRNLNEADYDGGGYAAAPWVISPTTTSVRRHGSFGRSAGEQDSLELQLVTSFFDDKVDLTTGVTYFEEEATYYDYSYGNYVYDPVHTFIIQNFRAAGGNWVSLDTESLGFYAQGSWHINDVSNLTLGLRRTEDDKEALIWGSSSQVAIGVLPTWDFIGYRNSLTARSGSLIISEPSATFDSTDWLVSYDYRLNEDVMVYGKVSTGFRAGGFNGRGLDDPNASLVFDPEELIEYELGLKGDFLDGKLRWNTAIYTNETSDKQFTVLVQNSTPGAPPGTNVRNAGEAEAKGFETEFTYLLSENWSLSGSYGYVDAEITSLVSFNPASGRVEALPSNRLPNVIRIPENEWTLSLNYDQEFDSLRVSGTAMYHWVDEMVFVAETPAEIAAGGIVNFQDASEWESASTSDDYGLLNMSITFSTLDEKYNATLWGKNVLDERKAQSSIGFISGRAYQYATSTYTEPATYGVTLKVNF